MSAEQFDNIHRTEEELTSPHLDALERADAANTSLLVAFATQCEALSGRSADIDVALQEVAQADEDFLRDLEEKKRQYFAKSDMKKDALKEDKKRIGGEITYLQGEIERIRELSKAIGGLIRRMPDMAEDLEDISEGLYMDGENDAPSRTDASEGASAEADNVIPFERRHSDPVVDFLRQNR